MAATGSGIPLRLEISATELLSQEDVSELQLDDVGEGGASLSSVIHAGGSIRAARTLRHTGIQFCAIGRRQTQNKRLCPTKRGRWIRSADTEPK
jgi:hypothetical protein